MIFPSSKMESSDIFNHYIRVKDEPRDEPLNDNDGYKIIDTIPVTEHVKYERFWQENSTQELLQEYAGNHKNEFDDLEIEMECTDMKPNLLAVAKIEDYSPNQWPDSDEYKTGRKIKLETVGAVKKEIFGEEAAELNFGRGLSEQNEKGSVSKEVNYKHRLKTHNESARNDNITPACDTCGKSFRQKSHLIVHIESVHRKITHPCDICQKTFLTKSNLKTHIDSVHNQVRHPCDICQKIFTQKGNLKTHIESVHRKITHPCDICQKTFSDKSNLRNHIESVHNQVRHACDICQKTFTKKGSLKVHINSVHNGVSHACNVCQKTFSDKSYIKKHINAKHNGITHKCDFCEKKFNYQTNLNKHVKSSHYGIIHSCETCGKTFGQKRNLRAHIDVAHRSRNQT